jgi:hypothetical protein
MPAVAALKNLVIAGSIPAVTKPAADAALFTEPK